MLTDNENSVFLDELLNIADDIMKLYNRLKDNKSLAKMVTGKNDEFPLWYKKLMDAMKCDLSRWFVKMKPEWDSESLECQAILVVFMMMEMDWSKDLIEAALIEESFVKELKDEMDSYIELDVHERDKCSILANLGNYSTDLQDEYVMRLYRIMSLIAKVDREITDREAECLNSLSDLRASKEIISRPKIVTPTDTSEAMCELNELVGLTSVKEEVNGLYNFIKIQQKRKRQGMRVPPLSYHCVFTGNPGTGKTTVARILAAIYKELGVVKKGHLVETDRSGLVAEYMGQTALKTNKKIDEAMDGILFIDEAYAILQDTKEDYGYEAIATLLKRMEDDRDRLVVILAGYTQNMKEFINANPGLQSRFNRYIYFPDYNGDELKQIFFKSMEKYDYHITAEGEAKLERYFKDTLEVKDEKFGNGRMVRNLFEKVIEYQATRLAYMKKINKDRLCEITEQDIPVYGKKHVSYTNENGSKYIALRIEYNENDDFEHYKSIRNGYMAIEVVGMKYRKDFCETMENLKEDDEVTFVPEPENEVDKHAFKVMWKGRHIAYVARRQTPLLELFMHGKGIEGVVTDITESCIYTKFRPQADNFLKGVALNYGMRFFGEKQDSEDELAMDDFRECMKS